MCRPRVCVCTYKYIWPHSYMHYLSSTHEGNLALCRIHHNPSLASPPLFISLPLRLPCGLLHLAYKPSLILLGRQGPGSVEPLEEGWEQRGKDHSGTFVRSPPSPNFKALLYLFLQMKLLIICIISVCCLVTVGRAAIPAAPDRGLTTGSLLISANDVRGSERDFQGCEYLEELDFDGDDTSAILTDYESQENMDSEGGLVGDT